MQSSHNPIRRLTLGLAALMLLVAVAACGDSPSATAADEAVNPADLPELAARLSGELGLSAEQLGTLDAVLEADDETAPGRLWAVAAHLQETLTDEQKATLLERAAEQQPRRLRRGGTGRHGEGRRFQRRAGHGLAEILTLEQQAEVQALREASRAQMKSLLEARKDGSLTEEDFRAQAKALREANHEAMQKLLTDEQKAALEARREEHKANRGARRDAAEAARAEALGLAVDQQIALDELREAHRAEARARFEQRPDGEVDRGAMRAERQALRDRHQADLAAILTPTQLEIVEIHAALVHRLSDRHGRRGGRGKGRRFGPRNG